MSFRIVIEPGKSGKNYWKDLWRYRELFYILSWRDIKVRYKQAALGIMWALLRPLLLMLVFTFMFNRIAGMNTDASTPYTIIVFSGLLPWLFFSSAVTDSSNSLIGNTNLITKVYFPRLIIPVSTMITNLFDYLISFSLLLLVFVIYQYTPPITILLMPLCWVLMIAATLGPGLFLTALNVKYRDFRYIIPFVMQVGIFLSPVAITSEQVMNILPDTWEWVYWLNPMAGVIDLFRWCTITDAYNPLLSYHFYVSLGVIIFFGWLSIRQFRLIEKRLADLI